MTDLKRLEDEWDIMRAHPNVWPLRAGVREPDLQGFVDRLLVALAIAQDKPRSFAQ